MSNWKFNFLIKVWSDWGQTLYYYYVWIGSWTKRVLRLWHIHLRRRVFVVQPTGTGNVTLLFFSDCLREIFETLLNGNFHRVFHFHTCFDNLCSGSHIDIGDVKLKVVVFQQDIIGWVKSVRDQVLYAWPRSRSKMLLITLICIWLKGNNRHMLVLIKDYGWWFRACCLRDICKSLLVDNLHWVLRVHLCPFSRWEQSEWILFCFCFFVCVFFSPFFFSFFFFQFWMCIDFVLFASLAWVEHGLLVD